MAAMRPPTNNLEVIIGRVTIIEKTPKNPDEYFIKYKPLHESNRVSGYAMSPTSSFPVPPSLTGKSISTSTIALSNPTSFSGLDTSCTLPEPPSTRTDHWFQRDRPKTGNEPKIVKETFKSTVKLSDLNEIDLGNCSTPENKCLTGMRKFSVQYEQHQHFFAPRRQSAVVANSVSMDE